MDCVEDRERTFEVSDFGCRPAATFFADALSGLDLGKAFNFAFFDGLDALLLVRKLLLQLHEELAFRLQFGVGGDEVLASLLELLAIAAVEFVVALLQLLLLGRQLLLPFDQRRQGRIEKALLVGQGSVVMLEVLQSGKEARLEGA